MAQADLETFFEFESDPLSIEMAAFVSRNPPKRAAFDARTRILADPETIIRTVLADGEIAGSVLVYGLGEEPEVSYWLGREFWGSGIATTALGIFLEEVTVRPLAARVVKDNIRSLRVLERCGFVVVGEGSGYAGGRGKEAEEYLLSLEGESPRGY